MRQLLRISALLALMLGVSACLNRAPDSSPDVDRHERFVGHWIVEQPYHALYEATLYGLGADGSVTTLDTVTLDAPIDGYVTGSVGEPDSGIRCVFADRWHSTDLATLVIDGDCSDGEFREITLGFADEPNGNSAGAGVVVLSVAGEDGWVHDDWQWRWRTCADPSTCLSF